MKKHSLGISILLIILTWQSACSSPEMGNPSLHIGSSSWGESVGSHLSEDPDFDTVFPQDKVNEITIQITQENLQSMLDDMTENYGEQGSGMELNPGDRPGLRIQEGNPPFPVGDGAVRPGREANPKLGGGVLPEGTDENNPIWVEAKISFEGYTWQHVGIRFKGNSSLRSTWSSGSLKLPFKLDFDQFEDEYPKTEDQRFYGFKQLTFSSNFHDDSFLREKIAADLFREAGVPSAQTAFYAVTLDYGEGPVYIGLYTAVEVVDDTLIETQFSDGSGNVYKPEGSGATFAAGSFTEASFDKETNQDQDDYSDILAVFDALHSDLRLTDPSAWRQALEEVFDVEIFLNWLAVNTLIQNWDTYGLMNHNYYLYNNPETGQLVWIPWDNNESLKLGQGMRSAITLDLGDVSKDWPLISYLRDDPVYYQKYLSYLERFLDEVFVLDNMIDRYQDYHDLISPYVLDETAEFTLIQNKNAFEGSVDELIQHAWERISAAVNYLDSQ